MNAISLQLTLENFLKLLLLRIFYTITELQKKEYLWFYDIFYTYLRKFKNWEHKKLLKVFNSMHARRNKHKMWLLPERMNSRRALQTMEYKIVVIKLIRYNQDLLSLIHTKSQCKISSRDVYITCLFKLSLLYSDYYSNFCYLKV